MQFQEEDIRYICETDETLLMLVMVIGVSIVMRRVNVALRKEVSLRSLSNQKHLKMKESESLVVGWLSFMPSQLYQGENDRNKKDIIVIVVVVVAFN